MGKLAGAVGLTRDDPRESNRGREKAIYAARNPRWSHEAVLYFPLTFYSANESDVIGEESELLVTVYDRQNQEKFLGRLKLCPKLVDQQVVEQWLKLEPRAHDETVTGEIKLYWYYEKVDRKHLGPQDFDIMRLIGRGTFGQVYQVRKKDTGRIYAMKVLSKKVIVQKKEVAHTIGERNILVRTAKTSSPFIVSLKFSFQTPTDLYLVTDYMSGGELFWHLQREGKFPEQRAKFYIAELVLALENLHSKGIVYRDLKPENILLDVNGHVALCDFGLSKANLRESDTTNTFCGTTEYLAPEVLLDEQGMLPPAVLLMWKGIPNSWISGPWECWCLKCVVGGLPFMLMILNKCTKTSHSEKFDSPRILSLPKANLLSKGYCALLISPDDSFLIGTPNIDLEQRMMLEN